MHNERQGKMATHTTHCESAKETKIKQNRNDEEEESKTKLKEEKQKK